MSSAAPQLEPHDEETPPPQRDPANAWFVAHLPELRARYGKGAHVAISPAGSVVAAGTLAEVHAALDRIGPPRDDDSDPLICVVH